MADHKQAIDHTSYLFDQLGITAGDHNPTFEPQNQKPGTNFYQSKYAESDEEKAEESNDIVLNVDKVTHLNHVDKVTHSANVDKVTQLVHADSRPADLHKRDSISKEKSETSKSKTVVRAKRGRKARKKQEVSEKRPEINLDLELNQVMEWGERGTKANNLSDSSGFQSEEDQIEATQEQQQIKQRIQQKMKKFENPGAVKHTAPTSSSLKSKAQELRRQRQQQTQKQSSFDTSSQALKHGESPSQPVNSKQQESEEDDPWQKINQHTLAKQNNHQKQQSLGSDGILKYFQVYKIDAGEDSEEQSERGFLQLLCGCLKPRRRSRTEMANRILTLARLPLTNASEEMSLLKEIWVKMTNKKFQRYGEHWNQVGFQGRDPATDLRSSGILALVQWLGFIELEEEHSMKIYNFCVEFDIPLALTHIKVTSVIVSAVKKRLITGETWGDYQNYYNASVYYTFRYIMEKGRNLQQTGEFVETAIERTKRNLQTALKSYMSTNKQ